MGRWLVRFAVFTTLAAGASLAMALSNGPPASKTGASLVGGVVAEPNCAECHTGFPLNSPGATLEILGAPTFYVPGNVYTLHVRMTSTFAPPRRWGFQITAVRESNGQGSGTWDITGSTEIQVISGTGAYATRSYVEHTLAGTFPNNDGPIEWTFNWQAPATDEGRIFFFVTGNAANNNGNRLGDHIYAASVATDFAAMGDVFAGLTGTYGGSATWGDYDGDGDLDLVLTGWDATNTRATLLYQNSGGLNPTFASVATDLPDVGFGSTAWGDYDRDGDLDLLLTGAGLVSGISTYFSGVYENSGGTSPTFTDIGADLLPVALGSSAEWGDYDNDGDLDILLAGWDGMLSRVSKLYRNNGGPNPTFTEIVGALPVGVNEGAVAWGDYDNDGDLDILLTGKSCCPLARNARLYRNSGGASPTFGEVEVGLAAVYLGTSAAWGDYDNDGDLDILITGSRAGNMPSATVYRNSGGADPTFTVGADLAGVYGGYKGSATWGDFDNDGYLDIVVSGYDDVAGVAKIYRNQRGPDPTFADAGFPLTGVQSSATAWGDYDNDGDLDLLVAGDPDGGGALTKLYRNSLAVPPNAPPTAPSGLHPRLVSGTTVEFSWDAASDAQTPASGLSYNVRIGTTPGGSQISSPMADGTSGYRRIPALGNANSRLKSFVTLPAVATYYWSVQAVDGAWAGSPFASEQTVDVSVLGVGDGAELPSRFALGHGAPNPFSRSTSLSFDLSRSARVRLEVFDPSGRRVRTLVSEEIGAGRHQAVWDGTDERGRRVPAGVYGYRLVAGEFSDTRRVVLLP